MHFHFTAARGLVRFADPAAVFLLVMSICATGTAFAEGSGASGDYEDAPAAHVSEILPPRLAQSIYHTVDQVEVNGRFYEFHVESEYGKYDVPSLALLKIRVHEIRTLGEAISEFAKSNSELSEQLHGQLSIRANNAIDIISRPVSTATNLAGQLAHNLDQTLTGERDSENVDKAAGSAALESGSDPVLAMHRRNVAAQWGLDVYSRNPQVQEFLNEVAQARSAGKISAGTPVLLPRKAESLADPAIESAVSAELKNKTREELAAGNARRLAAMRIPERISKAFLANEIYSPSHRTRLVYYLGALDGVRDRTALLAAAQGVDSEQMELAFEQSAMILVHYHKHIAPLDKLHTGSELMEAVTRDRRIVYIAPVDIIYWSQSAAEMFSRLGHAAKQAGFSSWELATPGDVTPMAMSKLQELGFTVRDKLAE